MRIVHLLAILISFYSDLCQASHHSNHSKVNFRTLIYSNSLSKGIYKHVNIQPNAYKAAEEIKQATLPQQRREREVVNRCFLFMISKHFNNLNLIQISPLKPFLG